MSARREVPLLASTQVSILWHTNGLPELFMPIRSCGILKTNTQIQVQCKGKREDCFGRYGKDQEGKPITLTTPLHHLKQPRRSGRGLLHDSQRLRARGGGVWSLQHATFANDLTIPQPSLFKRRMRLGNHHLTSLGTSGWVRGGATCVVSIEIS